MPDYDCVVVGAGHNGLVTAAYLARAGRRTLLLEARAGVGGTAASEPFAGATVNVCNCDHLTFRTTPVIEDLDLARFGLRYLDVEPAQIATAWSSGPAWAQYHDTERTLDELARTHPGQVDGYRRYLRAALPAARMILDAAQEPPTAAGLTRVALRRGLAGTATIIRWSRRRAADVLGEYLTHPAVVGPGLVSGPMVWGVSPRAPRTGLGALTYALRHVGRLGRPAGGSGALTEALLAAFAHHGGELRTSSAVGAIVCHADRVVGVELADGSTVTAPIVVSACDPRRTFVHWLRSPPAGAERLVSRWRAKQPGDGYESKIDAVVSTVPRWRDSPHDLGPTTIVAPTVDQMHLAAELLPRGEVLERPALLMNVPSIGDPSVAPAGRHVFSLEVLLTPYRLTGGWSGSTEPQRWLDLVAAGMEPGFLDSIVEWRAVTPDVYEREFHLPNGHATSFAGGPLAALRNRDPELTRYETAVPGLYLTGAATFPGAGIWGASGRNCATVVLAAGRIRRAHNDR